MADYDDRRLVKVQAERVSNVSSTDFPGHYVGEDHSWDLKRFKKVCFMCWTRLQTKFFLARLELENKNPKVVSTLY